MKQTESKKILSLLLVVMLCAAMALTGCSDTQSSAQPTSINTRHRTAIRRLFTDDQLLGIG